MSIREQLDAKIPRDVVSQRDGGGGRSLSFLEGWYVIDRLNQVLGQGNWSYVTKEMRLVYSGSAPDKYGKEMHSSHYVAHIELSATIDGATTYFSDFGYGDGSDKSSPGKSHELAVKEAVTDGIKRCAKNLGMSLGLALYDKTQENVDDGKEPAREVSKGPSSSRSAPPKENAPVAKSIGLKDSGQEIKAAAPSPINQREGLNKAISSAAYVLVNGLKVTDATTLKAHLQDKYKKDKKEDLSQSEAEEFLSHLKSIMEPKQ